MLHHCDLCPEQIVVSNILKEQLPLNYMTDFLIKYKQWVSTDRSNLEEHEVNFDYFLDKLSSMVFEVTEYCLCIPENSCKSSHQNKIFFS